MPKITPEIYLYEYPLSDIPVNLGQPVTTIGVHSDIAEVIQEIINAQNGGEHYPPTTWATPLLFASVPGLLQAFSWKWDVDQKRNYLKPLITLGKPIPTNPVASILLEWARAWRASLDRTNDMASLPWGDELVRRIKELWSQEQLLCISESSLSALIHNNSGGLNNYGYELLPSVLLQTLVNVETQIGTHRATWDMVYGRETSYLLSDLKVAANGGLFSYRLNAKLHTIASGEGASPVIQFQLSQQRFPDGQIVSEPENDYSILLRVRHGAWCKVPSKDLSPILRRTAEVGANALLQWDSIPSFEALTKAPAEYLDQARIVYVSGMAYVQDDADGEDHPLMVGMSFAERNSVLAPILDHLGLSRPTQVMADIKLNEILEKLGRLPASRAIWSLTRVKDSRSVDGTGWIANRVQQATDGRGLELVVIAPQNHSQLLDKTLPEALTRAFDLDSIPVFTDAGFVEIADGITCRIVRLTPEEAKLLGSMADEEVKQANENGDMKYNTARWRVAYGRRFDDLLELFTNRLPQEEGPIRLALVEKPSPPAFFAEWRDVKGAARSALAHLGYLSQFMNPYGLDKEGAEYMKSDADHRVRQGVLDGLRQLGVVLGDPQDLFSLLDLPPAHIVSVAFVQTNFKDIRYPVFSRLTPAGRVEIRYPLLDGSLSPWQPSFSAIPALIRLIWTTIPNLRSPGSYQQSKSVQSPLRISEGHVLRHLQEVLREQEPMIFIVPARNLNSKDIWPQLTNPNLGVSRELLQFGANQVIERESPAYAHLLGVVRYRGPDTEVPEYFPTKDHLGMSKEYLAPHGWYADYHGMMRYLGIGIGIMTSTNRETIHFDTHSLDHRTRVRPGGKHKEIEVGASQRYGHPRLVEFAPFFIHPDLGEDGPLALCRVAQLSRWMGWHEITLKTPWPTHVAVTALHDALDVIAKYSD